MDFNNIFCFLQNHTSEFIVASIGSAAGAYYGAKAAQKIIEGGKSREDLLNTINFTNIAITLSYNICNGLLSSKKQFIKPLHEDYEEEKKLLQNFNQNLASGNIPLSSQYQFTANLQTFPLPKLPFEALERVMFNNSGINSQLLTVFSTLNMSLDGLKQSVDKRNDLIENYKNRPVGTDLSAHEYFGLQEGGKINQDYPTVVSAIKNQTDDVIFFSHLLCEQLNMLGKNLAEQFKKQHKKGCPKIVKIDWSQAEQNNLLPPNNTYSEWLKIFPEKDSKPASGWNLKTRFTRSESD